MQANSIASRLVLGSAAGAAATILMQPLRSFTSAKLPRSKPPIRREPGEFMVQAVEKRLPRKLAERVPDAAEHAAAKSLALGYGATFGALYAVARPRPGNLLAEGAALGLVTWAAGYLGWLPALRLMPRVTKQRPLQVATPVLQHLFYGVAAVAGIVAARGVQSLLSRGMPD